jgi:hypothetical protein
VTFSCPGCGGPVGRRPSLWALRCPACGALLRSRPVESGGDSPAYDVEVAGRPETRRRVEVPWDETEERRLSTWLFWSTAITLSLVAVLYVLARLLG